MKVVTAQEMRDIDRITIEEIGIPSPVLMERAGLSVVKHIIKLFPPRKVVVLSGSGNNGGDGIVIARELFNHGFSVRVIILSEAERLSQDSRLQYEIALKMSLQITFQQTVREKDLQDALIIDALLGTGLDRTVRENLARVIDLVNRKERRIFSVDIPSGISSDSGEIMGKAVRAEWTVTFGLPKRGHLLFPGREYAGRLFVEDIGFPEKLIESDLLMVEQVESEQMSMLLPERPDYSHKGDYGHVLVIGGAEGKTGAALMAARSALQTGAGLVTIGVPDSMIDIFQGKVIEEMTLPLPDNGKGGFSGNSLKDISEFIRKKADVVAVGPGMGFDKETCEIVSQLVRKSPIPVVIDADGINSLSLLTRTDLTSLLSNSLSPIIITPHTGEFARLLIDSDADFRTECARIEGNRIETAQRFSQETGTCIVLKGVPTITASPDGRVYVNSTGNPGMATAGAGDVLTGVIASLIGQGSAPLHASILGVYLQGLSGDLAAEKLGKHSTTALSLISNLHGAIGSLLD